MRRLTLLLVLWMAANITFAAPQQTDAEEEARRDAELDAAQEIVSELEEPLYTPFVERYVLDELRSLRKEMADLRAEMIQQVVDRELSVSDKAVSYATNTVTYFFYLIAAVSSVLVIIGWTSIRDIKEKVHGLANEEITKLVETYEQRLRAIEKQLMQKTRHIDENREEIERANEVHALWLRANLEHTAAGKITIYDEILRRRPTDYEALTYKADAVLELDEPQWAVSLCHQALDIDPNHSSAYFQLACAMAAMGHLDEAVQHLTQFMDRVDLLDEEMLKDKGLDPLRHYAPYQELVEKKLGWVPESGSSS